MPNLSISYPVENQVVVPNKPFQVSGQASDKGMPEPISIDSVTVKIDDGPLIDAVLSPSPHPATVTVVAFSATVTVSDSRTHVLTVTATNDQGIKVTETVRVNTLPIVDLPQCYPERDAGTNLKSTANQPFTNWPQNIQFRVPVYYVPKTRSELAYAILQAESAGHHVRAIGSTWSFSDALSATAMIDTRQLTASLQAGLRQILAAGVDAAFLFHVEAGITIANLDVLLDSQPGRQARGSGGGRGQTLAGFISTSSHGGDSLVPPLADYICAIHLIGAGGTEHWIEHDSGITNPAQLQVVYPCLAAGNIHYDTSLFSAVLCSAGSMGVIYSVILKTVPQFGLVQHQVATTWEALLGSAGPNLGGVLDGSFLSGTPGTVNILDGTRVPPALGPFAGNGFSLIVINPYPLESDDASLSEPEKGHVGEHLCFVTNRVPVPIPTVASNPGGGDISSLDVQQIGQAARNALGFNILDYDIRFLNFKNSLSGITDLSTKAALLVDFLAQNDFGLRTISAVIAYVYKQALPVGDGLDVSYKLSGVLTLGDALGSLSVEAAFTVSDALAFVPRVFSLVADYAARNPRIYIGGYLSLRFVGKETAALLGMQQWSPTCCVEYAMLAGSNGVGEFVTDLQKLALASRGALHWGQCNEVMTGADLQNTYGLDNIEAFRQARRILSRDGSLATFDNSFTDRLGLSRGQSFLLQTGTPITQADAAANFEFAIGDFNRDGIPDLYCLKKTNTGAGRLEVHILSGASSYQSFLLQTGTPITQADAANFSFAVGDFNRDGTPDLYCLKKTNTGTGRLELHILSGMSNYQVFLLQKGTPITQADAANFLFAVGDFDRDGLPDVYCLKYANSGTGRLEVHVLNGRAGY